MKTLIVMMIYYAIGKTGATHGSVEGFETLRACESAREIIVQDYLRAVSYFGYSSGFTTPPYISCLSLPAGQPGESTPMGTDR